MKYQAKVIIPIILAVSVVAAVSVISIVTTEYPIGYFEYPPPCAAYCDVIDGEIVWRTPIEDDKGTFPGEPFNVDMESLHEIVRTCQLKAIHSDKDILVLPNQFANSTHHIDNIDCEWFPNDEIYEQEITQGKVSLDPKLYPLPDKLQLQRILDACENTSFGLDMLREYTNSTHYINNNRCEWFTLDNPEHPANADVNYYDPRLDDNFETDPCEGKNEPEDCKGGPAYKGSGSAEDDRFYYEDDFETDYTDDYKIKTIDSYIKEFCTVEMIQYLTKQSNLFEGPGNYYYRNLPGLPDNISENAFNSCEHELKSVLWPQINKVQQMDDNTETDFTEKCHFIPTTIHANFTDGKVITYTENF